MSPAPVEAPVQAGYQRLRGRCNGDVDQADDSVKEDRVSGARRGEISGPHQFAAGDRRDQGRLFQDRKPEIGKPRQAKAEEFRQQDEAQARPAPDAQRAGGSVAAPARKLLNSIRSPGPKRPETEFNNRWPPK